MGYHWANDIYDAYRGDDRIDGYSMAVLQAIAHCMWDDAKTAYPSEKTISEMAHISTGVVNVRKKRLFELGILRWKSGYYDPKEGRQYANEYEFVFPPNYVRKSQRPKDVNKRCKQPAIQASDAVPPTPQCEVPPPHSVRCPTPQCEVPHPTVWGTPPHSVETKNNLITIQNPIQKKTPITNCRVIGDELEKVNSIEDLVGDDSQLSITAQFARFVGKAAQNNPQALASAMADKDEGDLRELLAKFRSRYRQRELNNINNPLGFVISAIQKLPKK